MPMTGIPTQRRQRDRWVPCSPCLTAVAVSARNCWLVARPGKTAGAPAAITAVTTTNHGHA
jgi:hypothetical protein